MEQFLKSILAQNAMLSSRVLTLERLVSKGIIDIDTVADTWPDEGGGGWGGGWAGASADRRADGATPAPTTPRRRRSAA